MFLKKKQNLYLAREQEEIPSTSLPSKFPKIIYASLVLTGFSSLSYEILWQLLLSSVLGSSAYASTVVISCFLSGLALGFFLFGRISVKTEPSKLLSISALLELGIGFWALLFNPLLFLASSLTVGFEDEFRALLLGVLLIVPPTILMGGTLPLLTQAFASFEQQLEQTWVFSHARLYGSNTFGGFLGVIASVYILLPKLGVTGTLLIASLGNFIVAWVLFQLGKKNHLSAVVQAEQAKEAELVDPSSIALPLCSSFLIGFSSLSVQIILIRVLSLSIGSAYYLFSLVLGVYIFWLAVGGFWALQSRNSKEPGEHCKARVRPVVLLCVAGLSLILIGYALSYLPYLNHLIRIQFPLEAGYFSIYLLALFLTLSLILALPLLCFGAFEPSLVRELSDRCSKAGRLVGLCYGWNTLGSIFGAFLSSFFLLKYFNIPELYKFSIATLFLAASLLAIWNKDRLGFRLSLCFLPLVFLAPIFSTERMGAGLFRLQQELSYSHQGSQKFYEQATERGKAIFHGDGRSATSLVMEFPNSNPVSRTIFLNGKADGNSEGDRLAMSMLGSLGALFTDPSASRVGVLGFGTGMTVGAVSRFSKFSEIAVFELDENAPRYASLFDSFSNNVSSDPRLSWRLGDVFRTLEKEEKPFDLLISQPSNPWVSGMERLYSKEYYQLVRRSLSKNGLFVSWVTSRGLGEEAANSILFTIRTQFQRMRIFQFGQDYLLLAWPGETSKRNEKRSLEFLKDSFNNPELKNFFASFNFTEPEHLLAHELWYLPVQLRPAKEQSIFQPYLSILGTRAFFSEKKLDLFEHIHRGQKWFYQLYGAKRSYLAKELEQVAAPRLQALLPELIKRGCGGAKVSLQEPIWRTERTLCRDSVLAGMVYGLIKVPESLQEEIDWLKSFIRGEVGSNEKRVVEMARFALFDSPFLQLNPHTLLDRLKDCFSGGLALNLSESERISCQSQLVRTFSLTGYHQAAKEMLEKGVGGAELKTYVERNYQIFNSR